MQKLYSLRAAGVCPGVELLERPEVVIVRIKLFGGLCGRPRHFRALEAWLDRRNDAFGNAVLEIEDVCQMAIETVCPQMAACRRIDELPSDANLAACLAHAAFEYIPYAQLAANRLRSTALPL